MWFFYALTTFAAWGTADLFYKKGTVPHQKYTHLRTSIMVGLVMGAVAFGMLIIGNISYDPMNLLIYLPVSAMYILSMTIGYFGLRYLEISIASPIQNASGAVSCLIMMIVLRQMPNTVEWIAIGLITLGVVMLGVLEQKSQSVTQENKKYKIGFFAIIFPVLYCVIDSLGTALDGIYLDDIATTPLRNVTEGNLEDVANISYMLTFFIVAVLLSVFVHGSKREPFFCQGQGSRLAAAACEAAGQFTYVYAMSANGLVAAPMIASYCVASVVLARIFLKEKLSWKQYIMVCLVFAGILLLGILEGLSSVESPDLIAILVEPGKTIGEVLIKTVGH